MDDVTQYELKSWRHAKTILSMDFQKEFEDIDRVVSELSISTQDIISGGGNKSKVCKDIQEGLKRRSWMTERHFAGSNTHKVDCFRNRIALEIEWNSKDSLFDRDLISFAQLFTDDIISLGVIITRSDVLQKLASDLGKGEAYSASTTHMSKLLPKLETNKVHGCPILAIGITEKSVVDVIFRDTRRKSMQISLSSFGFE